MLKLMDKKIVNNECKELKLKLNWYICANTTDVLKNFAVIKSVSIKSFHCINNFTLKYFVF